LKHEFKVNPSKYMANIDFKDYQSLINGLFQAEGLLGVYFKSKESLSLLTQFTIG